MAQHNDIGRLGEEIATQFLLNKGFKIVDRNYLQKSGEIDIVAVYKGKTHFIEVKSVSCDLRNVSRENLPLPEENVTREKLRRLRNVVTEYMLRKRVEDWTFDVCAVFIDRTTKKAKVRFLENELLPE